MYSTFFLRFSISFILFLLLGMGGSHPTQAGGGGGGAGHGRRNQAQPPISSDGNIPSFAADERAYLQQGIQAERALTDAITPTDSLRDFAQEQQNFNKAQQQAKDVTSQMTGRTEQMNSGPSSEVILDPAQLVTTPLAQ